MTRWFRHRVSRRWATPVLALAGAMTSALLLACTSVDAPTVAPAVAGPTPDLPTPTTAFADSPTLSPVVPEPPTSPPTYSASDNATVTPAAPPSGVPAPPGPIFPPAPDRDLFRLAAELRLGIDPDQIPRTVNQAGVTFQTGREEQLWLVDVAGAAVYQSDFTLRLVSPHAYWYMEDGLTVAEDDLAEAARQFEEYIYPAVTGAFGEEWTPGVDHDPHLSIVHGNIAGLAGYYSSVDEYPAEVSPFSNEREAIYINVQAVPVNSPRYLDVLAHELQHTIHWRHDPSEETWVNEGLSELAVTTFRSVQPRIRISSPAPAVSLVNWDKESGNVGAHYWAASLFFHYLAEHYSDDGDMRPLVAEPAGGIDGVNDYLANQGYGTTFDQVFADWIVANYLDLSSGVYGYTELAANARLSETISGFARLESKLPQYAARYVELDRLTGPARIRFAAPNVTPLLPVEAGGLGCWWGNSGDSIASTLTRQVDLRDVAEARLEYEVWHDIEEGWDYGYLQVSTDGGNTWDILETPHSSPPNKTGTGFGPGYSGNQDWTGESVDLTSYAGEQLAVRFQYVTDDAIHGAGICIREPVVAAGGQTLAGPWEPDGFVLTDNRVPQEFIVQVIQENGEPSVDRIPLDAANAGEFTVPSPEDLDRLVVVVAALGYPTRQPASYTLSVEPASGQ